MSTPPRPATAEDFVARRQARRIERLQDALTEALDLLEAVEAEATRERAVELRKVLR